MMAIKISNHNVMNFHLDRKSFLVEDFSFSTTSF